jgi:hypothetical protein
VLHDLSALVVEDEQVLVGLDEIDDLTGHEPGDVEPGLAKLDYIDAGVRAVCTPPVTVPCAKIVL